MIKIDTKIEVCQKETEALSALGKAKIFETYNSLVKENNICNCCDFKPNNNQRLKLHILEFNKNNLNGVLLCDVCFLLKHFDKAVEQNVITLANSEYNQLDLIKIQRISNKSINMEIQKKTVALLKMSSQEYLDQIKQDKYAYNSNIKILFNKNFNWNNCR
jgi:hypothetical protein